MSDIEVDTFGIIADLIITLLIKYSCFGLR